MSGKSNKKSQVLSPKESAFCRAMITEKDQTAAAVKAGYSPKSARRIGTRLSSKIHIQEKIEKLQKKVDNATIEITRERIENELAIIGFSDMQNFADVLKGGRVVIKPWKDLPNGASRAVQKIKKKKSGIEFSHHDKIRALDLLVKLKGYDKPESDESDKLDKLIEVLSAGPAKQNGA